MSLVARTWKTWAFDASERATKTVAQAVIAYVGVVENLRLEAFLEWEPWSVGLAAGVVSLLTSLASKQTGAPNDASLV